MNFLSPRFFLGFSLSGFFRQSVIAIRQLPSSSFAFREKPQKQTSDIPFSRTRFSNGAAKVSIIFKLPNFFCKNFSIFIFMLQSF